MENSYCWQNLCGNYLGSDEKWKKKINGIALLVFSP